MDMLLQWHTWPNVAELLYHIVSEYFASLTTILIVYNATWTRNATLPHNYLQDIAEAMQSLSSAGNLIGLQWLNVAQMERREFELRMLDAVDATVIEGFITILPNTSEFLHARYFATRNANLRLKDKLYLFLCEHEPPEDLLAMQILQFYPHHVMIRPQRKKQNNTKKKKTKAIKSKNGQHQGKTPNTNTQPHCSQQTHVAAAAQQQQQQQQQKQLELTSTSTHRDINFEMWTQKFVGAFGNSDALLLYTYLPHETFANSSKSTSNNNSTSKIRSSTGGGKHFQLYANKLQNLEGRTLRLGSITYVPYTITNYVAAGTGNADSINSHGPNRSISFFGSEANIMRTFCEQHNCHLRIEAYGADNWGSIYENETGDGMLGDIYAQHVEVAIGCIYNWYNDITETSHPIARSAVTILGPAPAQFPAWRTNILPFNGDTWLALVGTILVCTLVLHLLKYSNYSLGTNKQPSPLRKFKHLEKLQKSLLDIFALFIQQPSSPTTFERFAPRFFLAALLSATITLENIYSGQLKSLLTIPFYAEPIDLISKWAQTEWKWSAPSIIWIHTVEKSDLQKEQVLARNFEVHDYDFLYNASFRPDYGLGIERLASGTFNFGQYISAEALDSRVVLKDDLYFDWTRAVAIRGWPLMPVLNRHIRRCIESGLYAHWELQLMDAYVNQTAEELLIELASGYKGKTPPRALNVDNISGALFVLYFGQVIAAIVLLLELFGHALWRFSCKLSTLVRH